MGFQRITINPDQMGGVPCIRGLRRVLNQSMNRWR
jgi:uncharacterized protein (DUF433 family)